MRLRLFEKKYADYLTVYKIPIGKNQLDPCVFSYSEIDNEPQLLASVCGQITNDIETFASGQDCRIHGYYLVGGALKPGNENTTDPLKVIIHVNSNIKDIDVEGIESERVMTLANELSGKQAVGAPHRKIQYVPTTRPIDSSDYEGIYDVQKQRWHKLPTNVMSKC